MMTAQSPSKGTPALPVLPRGIEQWPTERLDTDAGNLWFPLDDEVMRQYARNSGQWEPEVGRVLCHAAERKPEGVFIDVGANVGYFSCLLSRRFPRLRTLAFEPQPRVSDLLRLNTWPYADRVSVYACALGEERGTLGMRSARNNLGDTRSVDDARVDMIAPVVSLDELHPDLQADVVKIDVQGAELDVMRGMAGVIQRSPGMQIVLEFGPDMARAAHLEPGAVLDAYRAFGFRLLLIAGEDLQEKNNAGIVRYCDSAGPMGQVNLLLVRD